MPNNEPEQTAIEEEIEEGLEQTEEDIDELSEMLAVHSIVSEERHEEIITGVESCNARLEKLETLAATQTNGESPLMHRILEELTQVRAEVKELRAKAEANSSPSNHNPSTPMESPSNPRPSESSTSGNGAEAGVPVGAETVVPAPLPKKRRYRTI